MNYQTFYDSTSIIFIDIMVWVVVSLAVFEVINLLTKDKFYTLITNSRKSQVMWGAILGLIPGCAGPLLLIPLYKKRKVSLATLTAAFIATFGDAAFVILANDPVIFLHLLWMGFTVGIIVGYTMQLTGLNNLLERHIFKDRPLKTNKIAQKYRGVRNSTQLENKKTITKSSLFYRIDKVYMPWLLLIVSLIILPTTIARFWPSMLDTTFVAVGVAISYGLTIFMIFYYAIRWIAQRIFTYSYVRDGMLVHKDWSSKTSVKSTDIELEKNHNMTTLLHTIFVQVLLITFWVWIGFYAFELVYFYAEDGLNAFMGYGSGWVGILIAVAIGMIPGDGPQIAFANFFFMSGSPLLGSALLANSINQDGDAGFALASASPRTAAYMRLLNAVPAIIFGFGLWGIGMAV